MIIDLRETKTLWINLDKATKNADAINKQCIDYGIKNNERFPAIVVWSIGPTIIQLKAIKGVFAGFFFIILFK